MPKELQLCVRERKPKTSEDAATLADDIISARNTTFNVNDSVRKCLNCGKPGHLARDCRHIPGKGDGSGSREPRDGRRRSDLPQKREIQLTCYNCGKVGHIASKCPFPAKRGNVRNNAGNYFYDNAKAEDREYMCQGLVEGKSAELLVDSGVLCTLVHQALVAPESVRQRPYTTERKLKPSQ